MYHKRTLLSKLLTHYSSSLHILETKIPKRCEVVKLYWFIVIYWVYHSLGYGTNTLDCCDKLGTQSTLFPDCF